MRGKEPSREELYALVWERPASEVAGELGISDVAVGKLCKRLHVPKPPRGYWARMRSGKVPRRPALPAFNAELNHARTRKEKARREATGQFPIPATAKQMHFIELALRDIAKTGTDVSSYRHTKNTIDSLDPSLAAQVLVLVQKNHVKWVPDQASQRDIQGARYCAGILVRKLMPIAKRQIVMLPIKQHAGYRNRDAGICLLHISEDVVEEIGDLYRLVQLKKLSYAAKGLGLSTHAWLGKNLYYRGLGVECESQLCVSQESLWIQSTFSGEHQAVELASEKHRLSHLFSPELFAIDFQFVPDHLNKRAIQPHWERIEGVMFSERMLRSISDVVDDVDGAIPGPKLAVVERLWCGVDGHRPFSAALKEWRNVSKLLESWEEDIELQKERLCSDILGVTEGDNIAFREQGEETRIQVSYMTADIHDTDVVLYLSGRKYRKDGLLGRRNGWFSLRVQHAPDTMELEEPGE